MDEESVSAVLEPEVTPDLPQSEPPVETPPATPPTPEPTPEPLPEFSLNLDQAPTSAPEAPQFTDEDIARFIAQKGHDDLKHIPAYNQQVQRAISKYRAEQEKAAQENYRLAQWDQYFRSLRPDQLAYARENPEYDEAYLAVRQWRQSGGPSGGMTRQVVAEDMLKGLRTYFESHDDFKDVVTNWDELMQESDLGKFVSRVVEMGSKKYKSQLEKAAKTQAQAYIQDVLAKRGINMPSPETQSTAPVKGGSGLDYDTYIKMSPEQAAKLDPQDIDDMYARRRAQGK